MALSFGPDWQSGLLNSQFRLRFELGQGGSYVNMFTSAYDRARALARAALPSNTVIGVIAAYPHPKNVLGAKRRGWTKSTAFEVLQTMGIDTEAAIASWDGYWWPGHEKDKEAEPWIHRAVRLNWNQADTLLWNQIAHDIGILPQAPVMSKLVDVDCCVSVNAYDDRGMDITALSKESIWTLYEQFENWLLDYDRPRMSKLFQG